MKLEIKDGMLIRTKGGNIYKILDEEAEIKFRMDLGIEHPFWHNGNFENEIIKASHNIIDLIEVGDYVNGVEVEEITDNEIVLVDTHLYIDKSYANGLIETILTKEQFENNCYKIKDKGDYK